MTALDTIRHVQALLGVGQDGLWGSASQSALESVAAQAKAIAALPQWPYQVLQDGDDLVCYNVVITAFGGNGDGTNDDPQDDGSTASQKNTTRQRVVGISLAMNSAQFPQMQAEDPAGYAALLNAPWPRMPFGQPVEITIAGKVVSLPDGIVDLGPGREASRPGQPHGGDLTVPAAQLFTPMAVQLIARNFETRGNIRALGGAKFLPG